MYFLIEHKSLSSTSCWYFVVFAPSPRDAYKKLAIYITKVYGIVIAFETMEKRFRVVLAYINPDVIEIPPVKEVP